MRGRGPLRTLGTVLAGATGALAARALLPRLLARTPGGVDAWERRNHADEPISLQGGLAWAGGAAVAVAPRPAEGVAVLGPLALGVLDDLRGDADRRGLRGHLTALARGEVTTGGVKVAGLLASGLLAVALADRAERRGDPWWSAPVGGALVAGCANLVNLFDLRPGRALKVTLLLASGPLVLDGPGRVAAAATVGAGVASLPDDLAARTMLGDTGANPAGALVGLALARSAGPQARLLLLAGVSALTLASERVSFSRVIADTPWLDRLDRLGRG